MKPGTYKARAKEWALGMSKNGKEQIALMFEVTSGEYAGQSITWFGYFTETAVDRTLDSLRHCGWASDNLTELDSLSANEVELVLDSEEFEGKERLKVKWVNRASRLALKEQMSPQAAAAFAAKLRGKAVAHKAKYGPQPQSRPANRPADDGDPGYEEPPF
jgi:hypothetical protein